MADFNALIQNTIQSQVHRTDLDTLDVFNIWTRAGELIPPYWCKARDVELSRFWQRVDYVGAAFSMFISKFASIPVKVVPRDMSVKAWVREADNLTANINGMSDYGQGWANSFIPRFVMDYITTDNGAFAQIIGDAPMSTDRVTGKRFRDYSKPREGFYGLTWLDSHYCLGRDSRVTLADGSTMSILDIVRRKYSGDVLSIDKNGKIRENQIVGWYETKLDGRYWIRLGLENAAYAFGKAEGLWLTNDHQVLTHRGWQRADRLTLSDCIVTEHPDLSREQRQVLTGSLLGDATLIKKFANGHTSVGFTQSKVQEEWLLTKVNALKNLGWCPIGERENTLRGKTNTVMQAISHKTAALNEWRGKWYDEAGKKGIPKDVVLENFSPLMLATWYMDDGNLYHGKRDNPSARFYTNAFALDDVKWLAEQLTEIGIESYPKQLTNTTDKIEYYIYVTAKGAQVLFETIAEYLPSCMQYKLPEKFKGKYQEWNIEQGGQFHDKVKSIELGNNGRQTTAYCIDVANDHNFIAGGMVVHNCQRTSSPVYPVIYTDPTSGDRYKLHYSRVMYAASMSSPRTRLNGVGFCSLSRLINTAQHLWDISTAEQEELGSRPKRRLIIGEQGITAGEIRDAMAGADTVMDNQGLKRYSKSVVIAASTKPTSANAIKIAVQDLNAAMRGEDKEKSITLAMFLIALALNIPPRWLWPASSTGATKADAMYQHVAGMGGGVGYLIILLKSLLGGDMLAPALGKPIGPQYEVVFDFQDDEQDRQAAEIKELRSKVWTANLTSGIIDTRIARQQALDAGDLTEQQYDDLELTDGRLPDGTDILNLFMTTDPELAAMLAISVGDVLNAEANEAEMVIPAIEDKVIEVRAILANPERPKTFDKARQALAALMALKTLYEGAKVQQQIEEGQSETQTASEQGAAEDTQPAEAAPDQGRQMEDTGQKMNIVKQLFGRKNGGSIISITPAPIQIELPTPVVNVAPPVINIPEQKKEAPVVYFNPQINIPEQKPSVIQLEAPVIQPQITLNPVINMPEVEEETTFIKRDTNGFIESTTKTRKRKEQDTR